MPLYEYVCPHGHMTEARGRLEESSRVCSLCPETAHRVPAYEDQYVFTESGGRGGKLGRSQKLTEGQERYARNSNTILKETGVKSGVGLK